MKRKSTLRRAFHDLINKNGNMLLVTGIMAADFKALLEEKAKGSIDADMKKALEEAIPDLTDLEENSRLMDSLIKQLKEFVYTKIDPDKTEFEIDL